MQSKRHNEFLKLIKRLEIKNQIKEVRYYKIMVLKYSYIFKENLISAYKELHKLLANRHKNNQ
ncbi:MAG: hypothetical protein VB017_07090 [Endomicrobiaceae bacterium]|jgi:phage regulator Rha-like protein|nr:hypothetical protein [Endomicrobiaceae bacterium]